MMQPGSQVGRYEIQRRLGRGGMGTVYVAHDPVLGRLVAIKVFATDLDLPDASQRFTREARSAAALNHPNIVTVHDYGDVSSQPFIVMEYVQGETLAEIIRRKAVIPLSQKLRWMEDLCVGAAYAHRGGVLHRDIKPTNLMLGRSGQLKILDFGIARMMGTLSPKATALVGTPGYMAPEQILGNPLDHRADLFSIGVVGYELLAYTEAFPGETLPTITHRILTQEPVPLAQHVPDLPPDLIGVIERSLRKDPAERFEDAESMGAALARIRRTLESDSSREFPPTVVMDRPAGGISKRGTGAERRPSADAVGVAQLTPPPDPLRVDLARRRTEQIEACLERSRSLLEAGDAEGALDACIQALTLEESHPAALELERTIQALIGTQRAAVLRREAAGEMERQSLTNAQDLLQQARDLDPENPDLKKLERELRLARVEQTRQRQRVEAFAAALERAEQALGNGNIEVALASARDAIALDSDSARARELEAEALKRLDEESTAELRARIGDTGRGATPAPATLPDLSPTVLSPRGAPQRIGDVAVADAAPTIVAPSGRKAATPVDVKPAAPAARPSGAPAPAVKAPPAPSAKAPARKAPAPAGPRRDYAAEIAAFFTRSTSSMRRTWGARSKKERMAFASVAGGVVLVAMIAAAVVALRPGVVPTGVVTIDAVPWATVTRIEGEDGVQSPLPAQASTPLSLTLPAGTHRITLTGPPPESESRVVTVQVQADGTAVVTPERFRVVTLEEYFEQYLASSTAGAVEDGVSPPEAGVVPPAPSDPAAPASSQPPASQGAPQ
jgi:tetratricopeptide (TPR) repeat protein